jgi:hypothetical protein
LAVTVVLAFKVTVQVTVLADVHPVHELNGLLPAVLGAVSVTEAPESYVRAKLVVPDVAPLLSCGVTPMDTPVVGLAESTVTT